MSNDFFNIKIPNFQEKYGEDWAQWKSIVEEFNDYLFQKTWELYFLNDLNRISERALEFLLDSLRVHYDANDTLLTKKLKLRTYVSQYENKALSQVYLDIQEAIVGTRGVIYSGYEVGVWRWGVSRWKGSGTSGTNIRWAVNGAQFEIYINVKTSDSTLLDQIQAMYRRPSLKPAFYKIYLVDDNFVTLRTV